MAAGLKDSDLDTTARCHESGRPVGTEPNNSATSAAISSAALRGPGLPTRRTWAKVPTNSATAPRVAPISRITVGMYNNSVSLLGVTNSTVGRYAAQVPTSSADCRAPDFDLVLSAAEVALLGQRRGQRSALFYLRLP
jgi:hypothetical protein